MKLTEANVLFVTLFARYCSSDTCETTILFTRIHQHLELAKAVFKKKKNGQGFGGLVVSYVSIGPSALHEQQKRLDQRVTTYELPL